jgi:hypothetical protein
MVSSTGFEAIPPRSANLDAVNSNLVYGGGRGGGGGMGGGTQVHVSYGDVHLNIPAGTREVSPDVIQAGMAEWHRQNPPIHQHRNNI